MPRTYSSEDFYEFVGDHFQTLPTKVAHATSEAFDKLFSSDSAREHTKVVYMWRTQTPIPRLKGESNILYIGQTKSSISERYANWGRDWLGTKANTLKFSHIVKTYGPIEIMVGDYSRIGPTLLRAEGQMMWWYFMNHCEYPPINYTKTKVRNECISV